MARGAANPYHGAYFRPSHRMPLPLFVRPVSQLRVGLCAALILAGCAHRPEAPPPPAAEPAPPPVGALGPRSAPGPTTVVAVLAVHRTQQVDDIARARCGEQIAPPPAKSLWSRTFSSAPSNSDKIMPPPDFMPETVCDQVAAQHYLPAYYRVAYRFENEDYSVLLSYDPGSALRLDDMGQVLGPALLP
jgi:hypothetical protein